MTRRSSRNETNIHLIRDFADEVPGYLNNTKIIEILTGTEPALVGGERRSATNVWKCYEALVEAAIVPGIRNCRSLELWLRELAG